MRNYPARREATSSNRCGTGLDEIGGVGWPAAGLTAALPWGVKRESAISGQTLDDLHDLAGQLRVDSIRASTAAGSGHPTSSMSAADLMAVLLARHFRYDWERPDDPANDHLIFSKGHASPLLYSMFKAAGVV